VWPQLASDESVLPYKPIRATILQVVRLLRAAIACVIIVSARCVLVGEGMPPLNSVYDAAGTLFQHAREAVRKFENERT